MIRYLLKSGWTLDKTAPRHVKSNADGTMLDLCYMSITRDGVARVEEETILRRPSSNLGA